MREKNFFGLHLTLELYECKNKNLSDLNFCYEILNELPSLINMKKLLPPIVQRVESNINDGGTDSGGVTGFVMITESHISVHTFTEKRFVTADVYSCKSFDSEFVIDFFKIKFSSNVVEVNLIQRGEKI